MEELRNDELRYLSDEIIPTLLVGESVELEGEEIAPFSETTFFSRDEETQKLWWEDYLKRWHPKMVFVVVFLEDKIWLWRRS